MIPTFVIFLREGVEASIIVAILLSYLDQIGQRRHFRDVFIGVAAALVVMLSVGSPPSWPSAPMRVRRPRPSSRR